MKKKDENSKSRIVRIVALKVAIQLKLSCEGSIQLKCFSTKAKLVGEELSNWKHSSLLLSLIS